MNLAKKIGRCRILAVLALNLWLASACSTVSLDESVGTPSNSPAVKPAATQAAAAPSPTNGAPAASTATLPVATLPTAVAPTPEPPASALTPTPTPEPLVHIVEAGETLIGIAERYGVPAEIVMLANELIAHQSVIQPGWELVIPARSGDWAAALELAAAEPAAAAPVAAPTALDNNNLPHLANGVPCPHQPVAVPRGAAVAGYSALCQIPILSYAFGDGPVTVILVGGMHGGYEWNTALLAYALRDHFVAFPDLIPAELTIYLIPNANPDGLYLVTQETAGFDRTDVSEETVPGRFNGNSVDLNRNWDCEWLPTAQWGNESVNPGAYPFSEPESGALRDYFLALDPELVLFWHSALDAVIPGGCGVLGPRSIEYANVFHQASGYPYLASFNRYAISGDASDYLASQNIPSITVEMTTHYDLDWQRNLDGLEALFARLAAGPAPQTP